MLEDIRSEIEQAAKDGKDKEVAKLLCSYLSFAVCELDWHKLPWEQILRDYAFAVHKHSISGEYRIFSIKSEEKEFFKINKSSWFAWSHLIAKAYGWELDYIAELDVEDAIGFIQEILYADQLRKEWEWALSEKSVYYDTSTKKSKFKPLDRPKWLLPPQRIVKPEVTKIRADMVPPGTVMRWDADVKH